MAIGVFSQSRIDYRYTVDIEFTTSISELLNPFNTMCFLVPASKKADYLVDSDNYLSYKFYKVPESKYTTICKGELLLGAESFYGQQHTDANFGILIFDDSVTLTGDAGTTTTPFENLEEETQMSIMNSCVDCIGRNAIGVGIAETDVKRYTLMMNTFRRCDSNLKYFKIQVRDSLIDSEADVESIITDYQNYGATIMALQSFKAFSQNNGETYTFENRPDFVLAGALLNSYKPIDIDTTFQVGLALDGLQLVLPASALEYSKNSNVLDKLTNNYITYFQVLGDDDTEIVASGGGVYYQGASIPINMFLFAKYAQYILKSNLYEIMQTKNKSGVANVTYYNEAIQATMSQLEPYSQILLDSITDKSYTQKEINDSIEDKTLVLNNCLNATTKRTPLFTKATIGVAIA